MKIKPIETITHQGHKIELYPDTNPMSPREWDNWSLFGGYHPNYDFFDVTIPKRLHNKGKDVPYRWLKREHGAFCMTPLYLLDHSGLWIDTKTFPEDPGGWDTTFIGWAFCTMDIVQKMTGKKSINQYTKSRIQKYILEDIAIFNDYLTGNVYGWRTIDHNGEPMASVWGYYGDEGKIQAWSDAKDSLAYHLANEYHQLPLIAEGA